MPVIAGSFRIFLAIFTLQYSLLGEIVIFTKSAANCVYKIKIFASE